MGQRLAGSIIVHGVDDEYWPESDQETRATRIVNLVLDENQPSAALQVRDVRWGGECRVEVQGTAQLVASGDVQVEIEAYFYEGTTEDSNDLEDQEKRVLTVPADKEPVHRTVQLRNTEPLGGDHATVKYSFTNRTV